MRIQHTYVKNYFRFVPEERLESLKREAMDHPKKKHSKIKSKPSAKDFYFPSFDDDHNLEIFKKLEAQARKAINTRKIFCLKGEFDTIRKELTNRGWIERFGIVSTLTD